MKELVFSLLVLISLFVNGQIEEGKRGIDLVDNHYQVRVVDSVHFYTVHEVREKALGFLIFKLFDTKFKVVQSHKIQLLKNSELSDFVISNGIVVVLNYSSSSGDAQWLKWDTKFDEFNSRKVKFQKGIYVKQLWMSDVKYLMIGEVNGEKNHVWEGYLNSDLSELERLDHLSQSVHVDAFFDDETQQFYLIDRKGPAKNYELRIRVYDRIMRGVKDLKINSDENEFILYEPDLKILGKEELMISGTYSLPNSKGANGFYLGKFKANSWEYVKLLDFDQFDQFYYAKDSPVIMEAKANKLRKESKGKKFDVAVDLVMHPMVYDDSVVYLYADLFFEKYHTEMITSNQFGNQVQQSQQVHDGFMFTHSVVCGITTEGNKFMDDVNSINLLNPNITPQVTMMEGSHNYLLHHWKDKAFYNELEVSEVKEADREDLTWEKHSGVKDYRPSFQRWYGNVYLHFGRRLVKQDKKLFNLEQYHIGTLLVK
jgi:hypothetical protein